MEQKLSFEPELKQRPKDAYNKQLQSSALPAELSKDADSNESRHTHTDTHTHICTETHTHTNIQTQFHAQLLINNMAVEVDSRTKFLVVDITDKQTWYVNTAFLVKRANGASASCEG